MYSASMVDSNAHMIGQRRGIQFVSSETWQWTGPIDHLNASCGASAPQEASQYPSDPLEGSGLSRRPMRRVLLRYMARCFCVNVQIYQFLRGWYWR